MTDPFLSEARHAHANLGETREQIAFSVGVVVLAAKLAKVDGVVTRHEIDTFKRVFRIRPEQEQAVGRLFDQARHDSQGYEQYAIQLARIFTARPAVLEELLTGLMLVAAADDDGMTPAEMAYLKQVAYYFGFSEREFKRIMAQSGVRQSSGQHSSGHTHSYRSPAPPKDDPYDVLGLPAEATTEQIKTTYRKLIREHHPDKLVAAGLPKELVDQATEKMKRINAAYDEISKLRGII